MMGALRQTAHDRNILFGVKTKMALATALLISALSALPPDARENLLESVNDAVRTSSTQEDPPQVIIALEASASIQ
jgi:hypothetical protein